MTIDLPVINFDMFAANKTTYAWCRHLVLPLLLFMRPTAVSGANISAKVIDRLGRPVTNAVVDIHWLKRVSSDHVSKIDLVRLVSDERGMVKGGYDETCIPRGEDIWVEVSKAGFSGYSMTGWRGEFVLAREFGPTDIERIATLDGRAQINELREFLAGDFKHSGPAAEELAFTQEHRFRPALRALVADTRIGMAA